MYELVHCFRNRNQSHFVSIMESHYLISDLEIVERNSFDYPFFYYNIHNVVEGQRLMMNFYLDTPIIQSINVVEELTCGHIYIVFQERNVILIFEGRSNDLLASLNECHSIFITAK